MALLDSIVFFNTLQVLILAFLSVTLLSYVYKIIFLLRLHSQHAQHSTRLFALSKAQTATNTVYEAMFDQYANHKRWRALAAEHKRLPNAATRIGARWDPSEARRRLGMATPPRKETARHPKVDDDAGSDGGGSAPQEAGAAPGPDAEEVKARGHGLWGLVLPCGLFAPERPAGQTSGAAHKEARPLLRFNVPSGGVASSPQPREDLPSDDALHTFSSRDHSHMAGAGDTVSLATELVRSAPVDPEPNVGGAGLSPGKTAFSPLQSEQDPGSMSASTSEVSVSRYLRRCTPDGSMPVRVTYAFGGDRTALLHGMSIHASRTFDLRGDAMLCFYTPGEYSSALDRTEELSRFAERMHDRAREAGTDTCTVEHGIHTRTHSLTQTHWHRESAAIDCPTLAPLNSANAPTATPAPSLLCTHQFESCKGAPAPGGTPELSMGSLGSFSSSFHSSRSIDPRSAAGEMRRCEARAAATAEPPREERHLGVMGGGESLQDFVERTSFPVGRRVRSPGSSSEPQSDATASVEVFHGAIGSRPQLAWGGLCGVVQTITWEPNLETSPLFESEPDSHWVVLGSDSISTSSFTSANSGSSAFLHNTLHRSGRDQVKAQQVELVAQCLANMPWLQSPWYDPTLSLTTLLLEAATRQVDEVVLASLRQEPGSVRRRHSLTACDDRGVSGEDHQLRSMGVYHPPLTPDRRWLRQMDDGSRDVDSGDRMYGRLVSTTSSALDTSIPMGVLLLCRLPYAPEVFRQPPPPPVPRGLAHRCLARLRGLFSCQEVAPIQARSTAQVLSLLYGATTADLLAAKELNDPRIRYQPEPVLGADTETSGTVTALPPTVCSSSDSIVGTQGHSSASFSHTRRAARHHQKGEVSDTSILAASRDTIHRIGAVAGVSVPLSLKYLRIGDHLYEVTPVQDETLVQFIEERLTRTPPPARPQQEKLGHTNVRRRNKKRKHIAASTRMFSSYIRSLEYRNDGSQLEVHFCKQCMVAEARVVFNPCGHFMLCEGCAAAVQECPLCHAAVESVVTLTSCFDQRPPWEACSGESSSRAAAVRELNLQLSGALQTSLSSHRSTNPVRAFAFPVLGGSPNTEQLQLEEHIHIEIILLHAPNAAQEQQWEIGVSSRFAFSLVLVLRVFDLSLAFSSLFFFSARFWVRNGPQQSFIAYFTALYTEDLRSSRQPPHIYSHREGKGDPGTDDVVQLCAALSQHSTPEAVRRALEADADVLQLMEPPNSQRDAEFAPDDRVVLLTELLHASVSGSEAVGFPIELAVTTHTQELLHHLTNRCAPRSGGDRATREAEKTPLSLVILSRKQVLDELGHPLPHKYGVPLTVADVCVHSIDVTRPLEVLKQLLERIYEPMFRGRRYRFGIRTQIRDLVLGIQALQHALPEVRIRDFVEDDIVELCDAHLHLSPPQLVDILGNRASDPTYRRRVRQTRDKCLAVLQIDLGKHMNMDNSASKGALFGQAVESVVNEKMLMWEGIQQWVEEVQRQLQLREWSVVHTILRGLVDTSFEREFEQHLHSVKRILRFLKSIPDIRLDSSAPAKFREAAEPVFHSLRKGAEGLEALAASLLSELTVELVARWVLVALDRDVVLFRLPDAAEGGPPMEERVERSLRALSESSDVLAWVQTQYRETHKALYPHRPGGPSALVHPQVEALRHRCREVQKFVELHTLRGKQLAHVFASSAHLRTGTPASDDSGEVFLAQLGRLYAELVKAISGDDVGNVLWSTSPRAAELFDNLIKNYKSGLAEVDEQLALFVSELLASQYSTDQTRADLPDALNSTQFLWTFIRFRFLQLEKVRMVLRGYQQPVEEQLERLAVRLREDYVNVDLSKRRERFSRAHYRLSKMAAAVVWERHFEHAFRQCYDTKDYLSEMGWHQLLSIRNPFHQWRLNEHLAETMGFSAADMTAELEDGSEVAGTAFALAYLEQLFPHAGWQNDPHIHVAQELVGREEHREVCSKARTTLVLLSSQRTYRPDVAKARDLYTMHAAAQHGVEEKILYWVARSLQVVAAAKVDPADCALQGCIFRVVDVSHREDALSGRHRGVDADPNDASRSQFQMEVSFPAAYATLAADVRYMERIPLPGTVDPAQFATLQRFVHNNERRWRLAECLTELLRVYYASANGEDDTLSLLATDPYRDVNEYFQYGFQLDWSNEASVLGYVHQLSQKLPVLTSTVQEVREKSESVYSKIQRLHTQAYHPEAISQTVNELLTITTALSMQCLHAHLWVQRVQPLLNAALMSQLRFLFHGWTKDFLSMRDDVRFLEMNAETDVFHLRPLRVRMIVVFKEVRLETPAAVWRRHWLRKLDAYFEWVNHLPRLSSDADSYVMTGDDIEMDLKEMEEANRGYQHLLLKLPPYVVEEPLKAIEKCIQEAILAEEEWRSSQQFLNIDVNVMHQRFGGDLRRWSTAIQRMNSLTSQLMDFTQPNKLLGGIVVCADGVQSELSRKFDQLSHFAVAKFRNVLEQEVQMTFTRLKDEFARVEALNVIGNTEDTISFLCEVPRIKSEMAEEETTVELLLESEATLHKLGYTFPQNWLPAAKVQEEHRSLKSLMDLRLRALHIRRPVLLEAASKLVEDLEESTARVKEQLEELDRHPDRTPGVAQQIVSELYQEAERVCRIQEALGIPRFDTTRIEHMQAQASTLQEVWTRAAKVDSKLMELGKTPFFEMQPHVLQDELQAMEAELDSFPASLKTFGVFQDLMKRVQTASALRRFLYDLRSDAMGPLERAQRHWIALKQRLHTSWVLDRLTVNDIWASDPAANAAIYNDVLEVAQGERRIEQQLSHISTFWDSFRYSVTIYKKQICLVRGWDALFDKLADDLGTCSGMRASPFFNAPQLVSAANEVESRLNLLRQVMETLVDVQRHWVYLDGIFTGNNEIRLQLPHDTVQFERTTRELMTILPRPRAGGVMPEVGVQFFLQDEKLGQTLERMASQISAVQHALTAYLDSQRRRFPRFFFVGDDDLLEIMGNGTDPTFLNRHLRKMFTALAAFCVEAETLRVTGFSSVEGEVVTYAGEPIEVSQRPMYDWLSEAELGMVNTLRSRTVEAARELGQNNEVTLQWMELHPTQVLCLALQLWWVRMQERQFTGVESKGKHRPVISAPNRAAAPKSPVTDTMDRLLAYLASNVLDTTLHAIMRHRCEQMITIAVYQRDVSRAVALARVASCQDFEWLRVLRLYENEKQIDCCMADARIIHGFEYTGCCDRLVQTPLTDKCYFTLTQALHTRLGGSPVGPAGTGKTETVKALGMQLGRHVLVFNCDDTFDYQAVSRIFLGLCQVGAWGCFDEFNRLEERIMSALSLQIQLIQESLRRQQKEVDLNTKAVPLNPNVAIFITMNPGYAGRSNLPGNLKQLFRTVTMTVPDRQTIAEVMLFAQGFHTAERLSRKIVPLFRLCDSQFSRQAHYDFGLRALKSVLVAAGKQKRAATSTGAGDAESAEESSFMLACIMGNIAPKLVTADVSLFYPLLNDFFPEQRLPDTMRKDIHEAVQEVCAECGLTATPAWVEKICQLHSTKEGRHGIMMVGPSGTGKTMAWKVLMTATVRADPSVDVHAYVIEPKVLAKTELFGSLDVTTREWKDGVFSAVLRRIIESEHQREEEQEPGGKRAAHWIIFDGDVDPEWVENLNSVLDDNKILTLPNGERLALPPSVRIIFEVESLRYATPATVSRCGMLWFSEGVVPLACVLTYAYQQLEKKPIADARGRHTTWTMEEDHIRLPDNPKRGRRGVALHRGKAFNPYIATSTAAAWNDDPLAAEEESTREGSVGQQGPGGRQDGHPDARRIQAEILGTLGPAFGRHDIIAKGIELMTSAPYRDHCIMDLNILQLLQGVLAIVWEGMWRTFRCEQESGSPLPPHVLTRVAEKLMAYAVVWGLGAPMPYAYRERLASALHLEATVAGVVRSILEVEVDYTSGEWRLARDGVREVPILAEQVGANDTVIPTVDTKRHQDLLTSWIGTGRSAILCGPPGSGKTMSINAVLSHSPEYEAAFLNFSSGTSVDIILKSLEQYCTVANTARGYVMSPSSGKRLLLFCDEINLPALDLYGTQPVVQLLRQIVERGGLFRARDNAWIHVEGVQVVGACNPPTDPGRIPLPHRFLRWAPVLFVDFPSEESLHIIYTTYCKAILHVNLQLMRQYADRLALAMVNVYRASQTQFSALQQPHYLYSPRELSRWSRAIYEGMLTWSEEERKGLPVEALVRLAVHEGLRVFSDRLVTPEEREWTDFMVDDAFREQFPDVSSAAYERPILYSTLLTNEYADSKRDGLRALIEQRLQTFCEEEVSVPLVVFDAMVDHIVRLDRVLRQPLGHMLMAGASGVGKSMIARLAAWMRGYSVFWLKVHREYDLPAFEEDLRGLLRRSGCKGEKVCFLFDESNIIQPSFLEYMNALLASGEVPGLFDGEEWTKLMQDIRDAVAAARSTSQGKEGAALPHLLTASDHDLYSWFLRNVKDRLHVVFTINPSSAEFANRAVASPALFNRCTIDWFGDWEPETLAQIGRARLAEEKLITDENDPTFPSEEAAHEAAVSVLCAIHRGTAQLNTVLRARQANCGTFVTPRHFTDLVSHFVRLFRETCTGSSAQRQHLRNGLKKLDETSRDIEQQRSKLKESEAIIAESSRSAQEMLDRIVSETDTTKREKEAAERLRCQLQEEEAKIIRDKTAIERDLAGVEPALREAEAALNTVKPEYLREIRAYTMPPSTVKRVLEAVLTLMGERNSDDWDTMKGHVRRDDFLSGVKEFRPEHITDAAQERVSNMVKDNLNVAAAYRASKAAGPLLQWVFAQVDYSTIYKKLRPMQKMVEDLTKAHDEKLQALRETEKDIEAKEQSLLTLKTEYQTTTETIADLRHHTGIIAAKCERATTILGQLLDEQSRWEEEVETYETFSRTKIGDCIVSASFLAYIGYFDESIREQLLVPRWVRCLETAKIPIRDHLNVLRYLVPPSLHLEWEQHGLPMDQLCAENAMIMYRTERFPLLIDPTGTAARFLQREYATQKISKASFSRPGYLKQLEMAVRFGYPIILEDAEFLDPAVMPLLNQEYRQNGGRRMTRIGAHDVDLSSSFKLFLLTRDPNYQPSPTLAGQTCIINFTITRSSLYAQCLHRIIVHERPDVDAKRTSLLKAQGEYQLRLRVLEQKLLTTIAEAEGSLLENDQLIATLADLKTDARAMQDDINNSGLAMQTIKGVESRYRPLAHAASSAFFALKRFSELSGFYRFNVGFIFRVIHDALAALPAKEFGRLSPPHGERTAALVVAPGAGGDWEETPESAAEELDRIRRLTSYLFNLIHRRVVRGMFMEDHLVLALRLAQLRSSMASADAAQEGVDLAAVVATDISEEEWGWLLEALRADGTLGGGGASPALPHLLEEIHMAPASATKRAALAALLRRSAFDEVQQSLSNPDHAAAWERFLRAGSPIAEHQMLPAGAFPPNCTPVRRVYLLAQLLFYARPDDFLPAALKALRLFFDGTDTSGTVDDEPAASLPAQPDAGVGRFFGLHTHSVAEAMPELSSAVPLLMVADANYDPSTAVELLSKENGTVLRVAAMGSLESTGYAEKYIEEGVKTGCWVLLKNVHLARAYVDQLEKALHAQRLEGRIHANFRLFLTAERSVGSQQRCAAHCQSTSWRSTYGTLDKRPIPASGPPEAQAAMQRLRLAAAWAHATITERLFYVPLGWSKSYEFSGAEYQRVVQAIEAWSTAGAAASPPLQVDWVALRAVVAETIYGGKTSNAFDQLVIDIFCERLSDAVWEEGHALLQDTAAGAAPPPPLPPAQQSRHGLLDWVAALPDGSSPPQWLGLPGSVARVMRSRQAVQTLERLAAVQVAISDELAELQSEEAVNTRTGTGAGTGAAAPWAERLRAHCAVWKPVLVQLAERFAPHVAAGPTNTERDDGREPLALAVQREAEAGAALLLRLVTDISELDEIVNEQRKPAAAHRALVEDLTKDAVPPRWLECGPHAAASFTLHPWMADVRARLEHVLELADAAAAQRLPAMPIRLGVLFALGGFLTAFKQQFARERRLALEQLVPRVSLRPAPSGVGRTRTQPNTDGTGCTELLFTDLTLYCAQVSDADGRAALIEASAASVSALTSAVNALWSWDQTDGSEGPASLAGRLRRQDAALHRVAVPLYASASRETLLDVVDISVVADDDTSVGLWYERGVCLAAWAPVD
eukprot:gene10185-7133_t